MNRVVTGRIVIAGGASTIGWAAMTGAVALLSATLGSSPTEVR